jgi:hypothetical protein
LLSHATGLDPAFAAKIRSFYDGVKEMLRESLAEGQRLGMVAEGDTRLYATFTIGALKEILLERSVSGRAQSREEIVTELFGFLQRGFLRIEAPRAARERAAAAEPDAPGTVRHAKRAAGERRPAAEPDAPRTSRHAKRRASSRRA